ncbi:uncharacterized protein TRIVIDRAFT_30995 [Trichoderma virens Gv29-8]|uniref:Uncharacterized protein n=1 Tax=Hypocrea virens (strain Gv29-8 / FGSC 10586) TaxID=413071 RepID=G9ML12_HYPVG|nr:uncharacterized protein TRIVIDRAFT_30995 [Trichoderma virens Gv29-8]EHK24906.1 hypothetical protein TRIVIDRAFT_30995 [Trichoderma virens Gv29-8]
MALPRWSSQFLVFCLIPLVQAYHIFETNCSAPTTLSNYVSAPNTRGTLDILWSSLFTIFSCTWALQHPNIPEQRDGRDPGWFGDLKWDLNGLCRSILRMLVTIIAPELIMAMASLDMLEARQDYKGIHEFVVKDEGTCTWSLSHIYYANMGGFVIRSTPTSKQSYNDPYHLDCKSILKLLQKEVISELPDIKEEEIKDKSKGDMFVKVIAVGQILWSVAQIIARAARRLPVSPLEVGVVAFAVCAIIIHCLYWNKPQRVGVPQTILQYGDKPIPEEVFRNFGYTRHYRGFTQLLRFDEPLSGAPISIDSQRAVGGFGGAISTIISTVGAALFGDIHIVAWNFAFPSRVELILWRCASIYTATAPLFAILAFIWIYSITHDHIKTNRHFNKMISIFDVGALYSLSCIYIVARLFILVEMFRTLCFLPLAHMFLLGHRIFHMLHRWQCYAPFLSMSCLGRISLEVAMAWGRYTAALALNLCFSHTRWNNKVLLVYVLEHL